VDRAKISGKIGHDSCKEFIRLELSKFMRMLASGKTEMMTMSDARY